MRGINPERERERETDRQRDRERERERERERAVETVEISRVVKERVPRIRIARRSSRFLIGPIPEIRC